MARGAPVITNDDVWIDGVNADAVFIDGDGATDAVVINGADGVRIDKLTPDCAGDIRTNPGVSIKLSPLHPRYERAQRSRVLTELSARTRTGTACPVSSAARSASSILTNNICDI